MKTAVSIPDDLFEQADRFARLKKLTRSELYARALAAYLGARDRRDITEEYNLYAATADTGLKPAEKRRRYRRLLEVEW